MNTAEDRAFVVEQLSRARYYNARPSASGSRRLIIDVRLGVRNANRLYSLIGGTVPRPSGGRWLVRLRGITAVALLDELLPNLTPRSRRRAEAALACATGNAA